MDKPPAMPNVNLSNMPSPREAHGAVVVPEGASDAEIRQAIAEQIRQSNRGQAPQDQVQVGTLSQITYTVFEDGVTVQWEA